MAGFGAQSQPETPNQGIQQADNSYCYVCHRNLEKESLNQTHSKVGVGCEKCHGLSERHSSDEDGITPPQIMYSRDRVPPFCLSCHPVAKLTPIDAHTGFLGKDQRSEGKIQDAKKTVCTDCHGEHRLKVRTRRWDKGTGRLVSDDGVRMMEEKPLKEGKEK
jgi:uncharacterized Fe-S center protein